MIGLKEYANIRLEEAINNNESKNVINYWRGYIDGINAMLKTLEEKGTYNGTIH